MVIGSDNLALRPVLDVRFAAMGRVVHKGQTSVRVSAAESPAAVHGQDRRPGHDFEGTVVIEPARGGRPG